MVISEEQRKAIVNIAESEKSKAIGKSGVNVRLASMLTGYEISFITKENSEALKEDAKESEDTGKNALEELFN